MLKVLTVLRTGGVYGADHVGKVERMVGRHLSLPFDFVCLTDDPAVETGRIPLRWGWPGWWSCMEIFRPGLFEDGDRVFYLGLDTLVVGGLDGMASFGGEFCGITDWWRPDVYGDLPCVFTAGGRHAAAIWRAWNFAPKGFMDAADRADGIVGNQEVVGAILEANQLPWCDLNAVFDFPVVSYKEHCREGVPRKAKLIGFHGRPKPWEAGGWAQEMWEAA